MPDGEATQDRSAPVDTECVQPKGQGDVDLMQDSEWSKRSKELQEELARLERDIRSKEQLEDALIRKGREVMLMRARVAELYEQIKSVTEDRDALATALREQQQLEQQIRSSPYDQDDDARELLRRKSAEVETQLAGAERRLQALLEQRGELEQQLRSAAEAARELQQLRSELDSLRRQYALSVTLVSKLRRDNKQALAGRDKEINALRKTLDKTKL